MVNSLDSSPPHMDASRPSLGFPLGTVLLLIIIFTFFRILSCSYHCYKHRFLRRSLPNVSGHPSAASSGDIESSPFKPKPPFPGLKKNKKLSVPVLMPGDNTPRFIALQCPCAPQRLENRCSKSVD